MSLICISPTFSSQAQDMLADAVHIAFKKVVQALQGELKLVLPSLLTEQVSHLSICAVK